MKMIKKRRKHKTPSKTKIYIKVNFEIKRWLKEKTNFYVKNSK